MIKVHKDLIFCQAGESVSFTVCPHFPYHDGRWDGIFPPVPIWIYSGDREIGLAMQGTGNDEVIPEWSISPMGAVKQRSVAMAEACASCITAD